MASNLAVVGQALVGTARIGWTTDVTDPPAIIRSDGLCWGLVQDPALLKAVTDAATAVQVSVEAKTAATNAQTAADNSATSAATAVTNAGTAAAAAEAAEGLVSTATGAAADAETAADVSAQAAIDALAQAQAAGSNVGAAQTAATNAQTAADASKASAATAGTAAANADAAAAQSAADAAAAVAAAAESAASASAAQTAAGTAAANAEDALASSNGKTTNYRATTGPVGVGKTVGDVWSEFTDNTWALLAAQWIWSDGADVTGWKRYKQDHTMHGSVDIATLSVIGQSTFKKAVVDELLVKNAHLIKADIGNLTVAEGAVMNSAVITKLFADIVVAKTQTATEAFIGNDAILAGAVTAPKITASVEMSAKLGQFLTVKAGQIQANAVDGMRIIGAQIETDAEANTGIKMVGSQLVAYNNNGTEALRFDGVNSTITGPIIRTAAAGARVEMAGSNITAYDGGNVPHATFGVIPGGMGMAIRDPITRTMVPLSEQVFGTTSRYSPGPYGPLDVSSGLATDWIEFGGPRVPVTTRTGRILLNLSLKASIGGYKGGIGYRALARFQGYVTNAASGRGVTFGDNSCQLRLNGPTVVNDPGSQEVSLADTLMLVGSPGTYYLTSDVKIYAGAGDLGSVAVTIHRATLTASPC